MKRVAVVLGALCLSGCAQQILNASSQTCAAYGFRPGTDAFANCTQQEFARRQGILQAGARNMSIPPTPTSGGFKNSQGTAFLKGSYVQGSSRVCTYDRLGSPYVVTIGAADVCPISLP